MLNEKIDKLLLSTGREGIEALIQHMYDNGFFTAPCSGAYHLAKEGGLAEHSLNVYDIMTKLNDSLQSEIPRQSIIIVSLLHDLGKMGFAGKPNYIENILKSGKRSESKPYETNKQLLGIPHEIASIQIASRFIYLTENEVFSIMNHNGLYTPTGYAVKGKETKMYLLLHTADMYTSHFCE